MLRASEKAERRSQPQRSAILHLDGGCRASYRWGASEHRTL